uniref:Ubiquitin-like protease family profile domain-containing protein n=1 Tax=Oryza rufipogon TaxID=4529 RepID=A0A0E0PIJ1_ORYRU
MGGTNVEQSIPGSETHMMIMASDSTSSDDECSSNSKSDNKVADSDYANSISEEEETSDSDKYITKKISIYQKEKSAQNFNMTKINLEINYLDFKDFGIRNILIGPPPRISVWKGGMIKEYSKMDECKTGDFGKSYSIKAMEKLSYDAICSGARCIEQQGNNSNMSRSDALQQYHSKSFNSRLIDDISTVCKWFTREHSDTTYGKNAQLAAKPLKATQPISTQPDKEESNKDDLFVVPIYTIPAKKEVQPTKDLESNSTEFVIDIEGPYDVKDITGHTTDKTKFILMNYSNSSEDHKSQDPTQDESNNIKSANQPKFECLHHFDDKSKTNKSASLGHFLSQTTSGTNIMDIEHISMQVTQGRANFTANMGNRRLEGHHCDENEDQDDFAEFLYEEEPSDNINMVEQRAQPQINNEQSSPQTPLHINITSASTPATKQVIQISSQSSPDIGINSPRIAQMREPNQHAQTEERQYSMTRIIDSLNASGNCSGTRHNLYRPKRIVHLSKYKSSPYDNYTRHQTFSAAELNHYNNILSIVLMDNVKVTWSSLSKSLSPRGVVDTYVLNAYAKKIANDQNNKENEYRNFYFFHRISAGKEEDYENCARQTFTFARNKKPLHYYDLLIFPCLYDNHWFVFTVDIKGHHFVFLDSIYDENSKYHKKIQGLLILGLIAMWEEFSDVEKDFSKFDIQHPPITRQNNGHDCGIYAMKCMEWWNPRMHLKDMIRPEYIPNMSKQVANDLLFS